MKYSCYVISNYPPWYAVTYSALFGRILLHFYTISTNKDLIPLGHKDSLSKIMIEYFIIDLVRWNSPSFNYHIKTYNKLAEKSMRNSTMTQKRKWLSIHVNYGALDTFEISKDWINFLCHLLGMVIYSI